MSSMWSGGKSGGSNKKHEDFDIAFGGEQQQEELSQTEDDSFSHSHSFSSGSEWAVLTETGGLQPQQQHPLMMATSMGPGGEENAADITDGGALASPLSSLRSSVPSMPSSFAELKALSGSFTSASSRTGGAIVAVTVGGGRDAIRRSTGRKMKLE